MSSATVNLISRLDRTIEVLVYDHKIFGVKLSVRRNEQNIWLKYWVDEFEVI